MNEQQFRLILSDVQNWIKRICSDFAPYMEPMETASFSRLAEYYPAGLLNRVNRVVVDRCPLPPLTSTGIPQLAQIETWDLKGVPWGDTIFIKRDFSDSESLHFHELLHIVQWDCLGAERYLTAWAVGTITKGYRNNPLEEMAFRMQGRFEAEVELFDVVSDVRAELAQWPRDFFDISRV